MVTTGCWSCAKVQVRLNNTVEVVYVILGQSHYGFSTMISVEADEESARAKCLVANRDPNLYLSSCEVYVWPVGKDRALNKFRVYPSAEDAIAIWESKQ